MIGYLKFIKLVNYISTTHDKPHPLILQPVGGAAWKQWEGTEEKKITLNTINEMVYRIIGRNMKGIQT